MSVVAPKCRLAIIGLNYAPEQIGIARYTADLAVELARRGHGVEVIAGKPYYPQWAVYPGFQGPGWRRGREQGVTVTRCPHYVPARPTGIRRILHLASFALTALGPALLLALRRRDRRPGVVLCVAPALLSVPVAALAAWLAGAKLWVHVQDFEVEAAFATGLIGGDGGHRGLIARAGAWFERRVLRLADRVSSISPQMCARLTQKGVAQERIAQLRNWADGALTFPAEADSTYRALWGIGTRRVALYSGNISNKQGIAIIVEAARLLAQRSDIAFVICGEGPNKPALMQLAEGMANVQFHDLQPAAWMGELLGLASVHLLPQLPGAADLVLPSKLSNMLASGRPVVATAEAGTGLADEVEGCGLVTAPGDAAALAEAILRLIDQADLRARLGAEAERRSAERWSLRLIIDRLEGDILTLSGAAAHQ